MQEGEIEELLKKIYLGEEKRRTYALCTAKKSIIWNTTSCITILETIIHHVTVVGFKIIYYKCLAKNI